MRGLRRRGAGAALRLLGRFATLLRLPLPTYGLLGVPTRVASLPESPVALRSQVAPPVHIASADLPAELLAGPLSAKFRPRPDRPPAVRLTSVSGGIADVKGLMLTASGRMVNPESLGQAGLLGDWSHQVLRPSLLAVRGTVATLCRPFQRNLFHWLFEVLPGIAALEASGADWDRLFVPQQHPFQRESLALLGIDPERVVAADRVPRIRAERLIAVSRWDAFEAIPAWTCDFLHQRFASVGAGGVAERLFVSRADAPARRLRNEGEVIERLAPFGFRRVVLSRIGFAEQVDLFRRAEIVVGPHGAGLANAVFCRPGTPLVELSAPRYVFGCWFDLARRCGLDYSLVPASGSDFTTDHGWRHQDEDFDADAEAVVAAVRRRLG